VQESAEEQIQLPPAKLKWKPADWRQILAEVDVSGMPLQLGRNCILHSAAKDQVHLHLDPEYETLGSPRSKERLREKMSLYAGGEVQLKVTIPADRPEGTPAMLEKQAEQDKLNEARSSIADDPVVAEIVAKFDAEVSTGSIRPVDDQTESWELTAGRHELRKVEIDASLMTDDKEMLEDLVAAAVNDAAQKLESKTKQVMEGATSGMQLPPGMKMPF